jgi:hypothetical protein
MQAQGRTTPQDKSPSQAQRSAVAEPQAPTVQAPGEGVAGLPVPRLVKFAGAFKDEQGKPRIGIVGVTFAIYKDQEDGAPLWMETQNVELDEQGHYSALLGATKNEGLPMELFAAAEPRWLGVQVNLPGEVEQPRVLLVSVPYALKAVDAENLGGRPASSYALATADVAAGSDSGGIAGNKKGSSGGASKNTAKAGAAATTANFVPVFVDNAGTLGNSVIVQGSNTVGVLQGPTSNPTVQLDVNGGVRGTGLATGGRNTTPDAINTNALFLNGSDAMAVIGTSNAAFAPGVLFTKLSFFAGNGSATAERMTVDGTTGNVGVGITTPGQKLSVAGMIQSTAGGFVFPDSTVQTTAAQLPASALVRAITYLAGCDNCSVLTNADSQSTIFENVIGAMTVNSVSCFSDAGAPAINVQVNHGGSLSNVLSSNLTCSTSGATSTSFSTSALSVNDILNFTLVADGVAKRVTMIIKVTVS